MRRLIPLMLLVALAFPAGAQKYACVNTEYILGSVPEYNQALNKLNKYIEEWRKELEAKQAEVDELRQQYQQEAYLLPENLKQRRQDEIRTKEAGLRALQQQRFAPGGDLDQRVAREKNYAFVFDKASSATVLYVAEKYDISNQVLEMLGVKPGSAPDSGVSPSGTPATGKGNTPAGGEQRRSSQDTMRKDAR